MNKMNFYHLLEEGEQISIPIIQRDYAQGRQDQRTEKIRSNFVNSMKNAVRNHSVKSRPLILDFIFGRKELGKFIPFDGQQRLTTLFLLYLYAALQAKKISSPKVAELFKKFQYEVREETRAFGRELIDRLSSDEKFANALTSHSSEKNRFANQITNQPWFSPEWRKDATIRGMLVMLDEINDQFHNVPDLWTILVNQDNPPIQFYYEEVAGLDSSGEDLFIKMNARGRQLTDFENFKARFLEWLKENHPQKFDAFSEKFDNAWQQLFWNNFGMEWAGDKARRADECFYNFLDWMGRVFLLFPVPDTDKTPLPESESTDLFSLLVNAVDKSRESLVPGVNNLDFLENTLDALSDLDTRKGGVCSFFEGIFNPAYPNKMPEKDKISWFRNIQFFDEICTHERPENIQWQMLLACLLAITQSLELSATTLLNLRTVRNLLDNSSSEIWELYFARQVRGLVTLMLENRLAPGCAYNAYQVAEELSKRKFRKTLSDSTQLDWLEDHPLLRGCVAVFSTLNSGRENPSFTQEEIRQGYGLFSTALGLEPLSWDIMLGGFLSQGIFALHEGKSSYKYFYMGNDNGARRREIFVTSRSDSFKSIRESVKSLANKTSQCDRSAIEKEIVQIVDDWLAANEDKQMDWRWYFVEYPEILPDWCGTQGYYDWCGKSQSFMQFQMMKKSIQTGHWNPFLYAVWVEAGFDDPTANEERISAQWKDCDGNGDWQPIKFTNSNLALWPGEFYWRVWGQADNTRPLGPNQQKHFNTLQKRLHKKGIELNDNGFIFISGKNSQEAGAIDESNFSYDDDIWVVREYDTQNRIELGKIIALELENL